MPSNFLVTVEVSCDPMKAPKTLKRAAFVTICLVGVVIGVVIAYRALAPSGGLIARLCGGSDYSGVQVEQFEQLLDLGMARRPADSLEWKMEECTIG
jgi:hypothetical protein